MSKQIYLDNASTTKPFPSVVKTMQKSLEEDYGNPSSLHSKGEEAKELIENTHELKGSTGFGFKEKPDRIL